MGHFIFQYLLWFKLVVIFLVSGFDFRDHEQSNYQLQVTYDMQLNFDGYRKYQADLFIGPSNSLFVYRLNQPNIEPQLALSDSLETAFRFELVDTMRYSIFSDRVDNRILHLEQVPGLQNYCIVQEPLNTITWQFTGYSKEIQGFHCLEAKGHFAGRDYMVWFTDSIPSYFGPWKLHGLPGLILEAADDKMEVFFQASHVRSRTREDKSPFNPISFGNFEVMDRADYTQRLKDYIEKIQKRMRTKFARGYQVKVESSPIKSIEIYDQ